MPLRPFSQIESLGNLRSLKLTVKLKGWDDAMDLRV
jgi:hypothetical protein